MAKHPSKKKFSQPTSPRLRPVPFEALPDWLTLNEAQRYLRLGFHSMRKRVTSGERP